MTGATIQVSVTSDGGKAFGESYGNAFISATGRHVAFTSRACNLIPGDCFFPGTGETSGDTNNAQDVFVHDRDTDGNGIFDEPGGTTTARVSVASDGTQGNANSGADRGSISADGRYVAFGSDATNLVANDTNTSDRRAGQWVQR